MDRFHLAMDVIDRVPGLGQRAVAVRQWLTDQRTRHHAYIVERLLHAPCPVAVVR